MKTKQIIVGMSAIVIADTCFHGFPIGSCVMVHAADMQQGFCRISPIDRPLLVMMAPFKDIEQNVRVLIDIKGGSFQAFHSTIDMRHVLIDHDNLENDEDMALNEINEYEPDSIISQDEFCLLYDEPIKGKLISLGW